MPPNPVAGVDGCRAGWVVASLARDRAGAFRIEARVAATLASALAGLPGGAPVALDMPIGLLDERREGGRACDREARRLLGPRRSSVFSPPTRRALRARSFDAARRLGVSAQAFNLVPKLREVDALLAKRPAPRVLEAHPELAFAALSGGLPMRHPKRTREGRAERLAALAAAPGAAFREAPRVLRRILGAHARREVAADDVLDAFALAWTAWRVRRGEARRLPAEAARRERDARGLPMEIWY